MEDCENLKCDMMSFHLDHENEDICKEFLQMVYFSGWDSLELLAIAHKHKEEGNDLFKI